jgi:hypothetical protein
MKQLIALLAMIALLGLVSACGSGDDQEQNDRTAVTHQEADGDAHDAEGHSGEQMETDKKEELPSSDAWVREPPIDVTALDANGDGYVYQDPMDWNVIADEEGKCPQCGMLMKRVSIVQATENLRKFGFEVVERPEN